MGYSTLEQVKAILGGAVRNDAVAFGPDYTPLQLTDADIEYEIANADAQIDLVLSRIYELPIVGLVPDVLSKLSADLASALCDMRFRGGKDYGNRDGNPFQLRYRRAMQMLEYLAGGRYILDIPMTDRERGAVFNSHEQLLTDKDAGYLRRNGPSKGSKGEYAEWDFARAADYYG